MTCVCWIIKRSVTSAELQHRYFPKSLPPEGGVAVSAVTEGVNELRSNVCLLSTKNMVQHWHQGSVGKLYRLKLSTGQFERGNK